MTIGPLIRMLFCRPRSFVETMLRIPFIAKLIPDSTAISIFYYLRFHKRINIQKPETFNEKLLWLTLYDRRPEYNIMVDKYAAKNYIIAKLCQVGMIDTSEEGVIIPTYGIYKNFDEIDFDNLPESFVMKTTHDSGGVVVVNNKEVFDKRSAKKKLEKSLRRNYFWFSREWAYRDVVPRIIIEKKIETTEKTPIDYKIFCFDGEAKYLYLVRDREIKETVDYYDIEWNHLPIRQVYENNTKTAVKPSCWSQMVETAKLLSKGYPFLRVDFYVDSNNRFFVGELTLTPSSGLLPITPEEWDYKMGSLIELPPKKR